VSTFAVYAPFPDGRLTEETRDGNRSAVYVNTKLDLEKCVFEMARDRGVSATIVQPTIVYGPFCKPWTNSPAEMLIFGEVILPDRGQGLCNAVYIDDLTAGLVLAAVSPEASGERFIISGPQPVTWASFFTEFARALGTNPPTYRSREEISKATRGIVRTVRLTVSDPRRLIKTIVSWNPARDPQSGSTRAAPFLNSHHGYYLAGEVVAGQTSCLIHKRLPLHFRPSRA
jgi:nucleoside-diphosphate-sugar epimerase